MFKENRLVNYWKVVNGQNMWFADIVTKSGSVVTPTAEAASAITNYSSPQQAANPEIIRQYDTTEGKKGSVVETTPTTASSGMNPDYAKKQDAFLEAQKTNPNLTWDAFSTDYGNAAPGTYSPSGATGTFLDTSAPSTVDGYVNTVKQSEYEKQLKELGFGSGQLKTLQELVQYMPEDTEEQRIKKKKAQAALSGYSQSGGTHFFNPGVTVSAEGMRDDYKKAWDEMKAKQESETAYLQGQVSAANKADQYAYNQSAKAAESGVAAAKSQFAQSKEGPGGSSAPQIAFEFQKDTNEKLGVQRTQLEAQMSQRDRLLEQLKEAQKNQDKELADSLSKSLAATANSIAKLQTEAKTLAAETMSKAMDWMKTVGTSAIDGMDLSSLTTLLGGDSGTALAVKSLAASAEKGNLSGSEYLGKIDKAIYDSLPQSAKEFLFYQDLYKKDPVEAEKYAKKFGLDSSKTVGDWTSAENKKVTDAIKLYDDSGVAVPTNSKYKFDVSGNSISWDIPIGTVCDESRWQCGEMVNDALGIKSLFMDSYEEKKQVTNSSTPVAGGAVVFNTGDTVGHVGLVEQVFENGYTVRDSNRVKNKDGKGIVDTMFIPFGSKWDKMVPRNSEGTKGFYNPYQKKSEKQDANALMKFQNVRVSLPTRLVDSDKDAENLQKVIDAFPNATSTEIKRRFVLGEEYDTLDDNTKNAIDQILDISTGITDPAFNVAGVITQAKRGNFISPINTVENARLKETVDPEYNIFNSEMNLKLIGRVSDLVNAQGENIGKIQGGIFKLGKKTGLNNEDAQEVETLLTWMIAPTRNQIAGTAVTEYEEKFLEPIIPSISDPEKNLKSKLATLQRAYMMNYNAARSSSGLPEITIEDIKNPQLKVKRYMGGETLQKQVEEKDSDAIWNESQTEDLTNMTWDDVLNSPPNKK
jgi:hypothetical protein